MTNFDYCEFSPTKLHSNSWYCNSNCEHCGKGEESGPLLYVATETSIGANVEKDAKRYQWLSKQKKLLLQSSGELWKDANGNSFVNSHILCAGNTQFRPGKSLDDVIDAAMQIDP